jgi:hypothetical protein
MNSSLTKLVHQSTTIPKFEANFRSLFSFGSIMHPGQKVYHGHIGQCSKFDLYSSLFSEGI